MKVKIFSGSEREIEKEINDFIEEIKNQHMEVKDIKYTMSGYGFVSICSALIMYGPDGNI